MPPRTDRDRFRDPTYIGPLLRTFLRIDAYQGYIGPLTPEQQKILNAEMSAFVEYWKGALDIAANIVTLGVSARTAAAYFELVVRTGGSVNLIKEILKYTLQFNREAKSGAAAMEYIVKNLGLVSKELLDIKSKSGRTLVLLVIIQLSIHLARGDYAKFLGELAKTAFSLVIAPAALIDLIDSIFGFFMPEWVLKLPAVRVLRAMNPAQCAGYVIENISWLCYCSALAVMKGWKETSKALDAWCVELEKSPLGIYTCLSRDTAMLFDEYLLPEDLSKINILWIEGATIRNLADNARMNPTNY